MLVGMGGNQKKELGFDHREDARLSGSRLHQEGKIESSSSLAVNELLKSLNKKHSSDS